MNAKNKQMNTPVGVAVYPRLNEPDYKFKPEGEFSVTLRLSETDARPLITELENMLDKWHTEESKVRRKPNLRKAPLPVKPAYDEEGNETDDWDFKFKMKYQVTTQSGKSWSQRPKLYDSDLKGYNGGVIGGGSKLAVNFVPATYYTPALGCGITLRLNAVQVNKLSEYVPQNTVESLGFKKQPDGYKSPEKSEEDVEVEAAEKDEAPIAAAGTTTEEEL